MHLSLKRTLFILSVAVLMVAMAFTPVRAAVNEIVWRKSFAVDVGLTSALATDRNGNVVALGNTWTEAEGEGPPAVSKLSGGGRTLWTRPIDEPGYGASLGDVAVDSDGHIYTVGEVEATFYINKFGPRGGHHWRRKISGDGWPLIQGVDVGPGGNIYIVGDIHGELPNMPRSSLEGDAFIRKYNPEGKIYWTRQFSLSDFKARTQTFDVAVGPGGGVYVVGLDNSLEQRGESLFLRKYSPRGGVYWTRRVARKAPSRATSGFIAVDRAGGVTIVTEEAYLDRNGGLDVGDNSEVTGFASESVNAVATKYSHKGKRLWTRRLDNHMARDMAVDRDRNVYIVGESEKGKAFVRKYAPDGKRQWTRNFANGSAMSVAADSANNVYVTAAIGNGPDYTSILVKFRP